MFLLTPCVLKKKKKKVLAVLVPLSVIFGRSAALVSAVNTNSIREHLQSFQQIADANGGNRGSLGRGFNDSVSYVVQKLVGVGYLPYRQTFEFPYFETLESPRFVVNNVSASPSLFRTLPFGGSGSVSGTLRSVGQGCEEGDYAGFIAGNVALAFDSNKCTTQQRLNLAVSKKAGAVAVAVTSANGTLIGGGLIGPDLSTVPVLRVTKLLGDALAIGAVGETVEVSTLNKVTTAYSTNIITETTGDSNSVIVVGAHLDSVEAGPGINDNGSGSSTILTIAMEMARLEMNPRNKVRFVWFGGEEKGLYGSQYYVNSLQGDDRFKIAMMLNFDMVGSPNYFLGVYDGSSASLPSGAIQQAMQSFAASRQFPFQPTPFTGRSDYGPFIALSPPIPAGGLFTGAEALKTDAEGDLYGGLNGVSFDPCYHQSCDTIENIDYTALYQASQVASYAVEHFASMANLRESIGSI